MKNSEEGAALVSPAPIGSVYFRLPSSQELNVNPAREECNLLLNLSLPFGPFPVLCEV